jgi:hypothetical protein
VNFAAELGHFEAGKNGDMDADDGMCFQDLPVPGCFGEDIDFDGNSYQLDWPDRTKNNATSVLIHSVGPRTVGVQGYSLSYPQIQIETEVGGSESGCMSDATGCVVPPPDMTFYPYYSVLAGIQQQCTFVFGNIHGPGANSFGGRFTIWHVESNPLLWPNHERLDTESLLGFSRSHRESSSSSPCAGFVPANFDKAHEEVSAMGSVRAQ